MAVYFLQADSDGPVKIGWAANDVNGRVKQFQTGHFMDLRLIREIPEADRLDEADLHRFFVTERIRGEWFRYSDLMLSVTLDDARTQRTPRASKRQPKPCEAGSERELLRELRKTAHMLTKELAAFVGVRTSYICDIEAGRRPLSRDALARMPAEIRGPLVRARIAELEKLL